MRMVVTAAVSIAVFGSVMTLYTGFNQMDHDKIQLIFSLGGSKKDILTKVLLPGSLPLLMSTMKVNIGLCLVGVIIGEFLSAKAGLGYLITYASQTFEMTKTDECPDHFMPAFMDIVSGSNYTGKKTAFLVKIINCRSW